MTRADIWRAVGDGRWKGGEVVDLVRARRLHGVGIGWTDIRLLAPTLASGPELHAADVGLHKAFCSSVSLSTVEGLSGILGAHRLNWLERKEGSAGQNRESSCRYEDFQALRGCDQSLEKTEQSASRRGGYRLQGGETGPVAWAPFGRVSSSVV